MEAEKIIKNCLLWTVASPVYLLRWGFSLPRRWRFWRTAYRPSIICRNCRATISLVGLWHCACGYSFRGHLVRECPVCGSLPRMVRCYSCGLTEKLPEP